MKNQTLILILILLTMLYTSAHARIITVEFTAEVTQVSDSENILEGEIKEGNVINGTYTYDTSVLPSPDVTWEYYKFRSPPSGILTEVGSLLFKTDSNNVELDISIINDAVPVNLDVYDRFTIWTKHNVMFSGDVQNTEITEVEINIFLEDHSRDTYPPHPLTALLSEELPVTAPNLADWSKRDIEISGGVSTGSSSGRGGTVKGFYIKGRLTSATLISDPTKIYVDDDATGTNDGSSWENAYNYLQDALADVNSSDKPVEIRVAQGTYQPDMGEGINKGDREASFHLMSQVSIKGGYTGLSGPNPDIQNFQLYKTILTGDLNSDDLPGFANRSDNSYHVLSAIDVDESAYIEGIIITSGNADGLPANDPNTSQRRDDHSISGGGLYLCGVSRLFNCNFSGNKAYGSCGAICAGEYIPADHRIRSEMVLKNSLLQGNTADTGGVFGEFLDTDQIYVFINCSLADNRSNTKPFLYPSLYNTIIWNNNPKIRGVFYSWYCDVNDSTSENHFNIKEDPLFAAPGQWDQNGTPDDANDDYWVEGDYHLKSQAGRFDPNSQTWVQDDVTSPCIDAGDPNSPIGLEPFPNGGYINMGAYGGTSEASKSYFGKPVCETIVAGDINGDCKVDEIDLEILMLHWLEDNN